MIQLSDIPWKKFLSINKFHPEKRFQHVLPKFWRWGRRGRTAGRRRPRFPEPPSRCRGRREQEEGFVGVFEVWRERMFLIILVIRLSHKFVCKTGFNFCVYYSWRTICLKISFAINDQRRAWFKYKFREEERLKSYGLLFLLFSLKD